jgi:hypothetical protein
MSATAIDKLDTLESADYQHDQYPMEETMNTKLAGRFALILFFGSMLAACGDTWSGMKEDTGQNMEAVGDTVSKAGEEVKKDAE